MAVSISEAEVRLVIDNLKKLVSSSSDLIAIDRNARDLCEDLEMLKFIIEDHQQRNYDQAYLEKMARDIRDLACKAEENIETSFIEECKQRTKGKIESLFQKPHYVLELQTMKKEIDEIRSKVNKIYQQYEQDKFGFQSHKFEGTISIKEAREERMKFPVDDDMVGFKDAMNDIMEYLKGGPDELQIISIVGMLGLGKTVLARQVLKHPTVEFQFFIRAFVEASPDFNKRGVLLKLVRGFGNITVEDMNRMSDNELEQAIRSYLDKRTYLIVLDDVWTKEAWSELKDCFPNNMRHSRVLITTRNGDVAQHCWRGFKPYRLRFLKSDESRELLRKRIFGRTDAMRADLEVYETAILDRCDGLPLAIVVAAGILVNNREASYWWEDVSKKAEVFNFAEGAGHVIKLSFNHLPYRLKPCFLYLGVFREDSEIHAKTLIKLWVAEGFVPPGDAYETAEDIAENYLELLVDRSLVMVEKTRLNGRIKTIRINDTLREFCKTQAIEEELFREIKFGEEFVRISPDDDRRLCINSRVGEYITSRNKQTGTSVRSFLSFAKEDFILPLEYISEIPKAFKLLKVLDVRSIMFTRFPTELFYAFLLKYLAMFSDLKVIPEKLSFLKYLQTLIFNTTQRSIELRADIWKMKQFRHLQTNVSTNLQKTKEALSVNASLQTLSTISTQSCTPEIFKRAQNLKKLSVSGELAFFMDTLFGSLSKLDCLENLKLLNVNTTVLLKSLPSDDSFPRNLTRLTLQNTMLSWEWMSTLAKLKRLVVLKLKDNAFVGGVWDTETTGCFYALQVLHIGNTDLVTWKASKFDFPQLKQLYLRHCTKLEHIPSDLVNISTLEVIDIYCCKPVLGMSASKDVFSKLQVQVQEKKDKSAKLKLLIYPPEQ